MIESRKMTGKDKSHLQHLHDRSQQQTKQANKNIYLRWLFVACFLWTWQGGGRDKLSRAHYEFTGLNLWENQRKSSTQRAQRQTGVFAVLDGVMTESRWGHATMKTNQISNAHASYGRTTSDRPSSSLPSWILRSLTTLAFSRRINSSFNLFFNVRGMRRGGIIAGATVISTSRWRAPSIHPKPLDTSL